MPGKPSHKAVGERGEAIAAEFLEAQGYKILAQQYRYERAEVDLVCFEPAARYQDGGELVFVEVKTRSGTGYGRPEDAVTEVKQHHVIRAAKAYLHEQRMTGTPCRFDVIAIVLRAGQAPEITHFKDAFLVL